MRKEIVMSIHPEHTNKILAGIKKHELRKIHPACKTPFRIYIYETLRGEKCSGVGKIIGECICNSICHTSDIALISKYAKITEKQATKYLDGKDGYLLELSSVEEYKIYKNIEDFGLVRRKVF